MVKTKRASKQNKQKAGDKFTQIDFSYINMHEGGWANIQPDCFIRPVGTKTMYPLVKAQGISIAPKEHVFKRKGERLSYTLFFPSLPKDIKKIDIIEKEDGSVNSFNFYGVSIEKIKKEKIKVNSVFNKPVKFDKKKIYAAEVLCNGYYANERSVAILRPFYDRENKCDVFEWLILENSHNGWYNHYKTFKEAWDFEGMNMREKKIFNNQKDFFKWAYSLIRKNKIY